MPWPRQNTGLTLLPLPLFPYRVQSIGGIGIWSVQAQAKACGYKGEKYFLLLVVDSFRAD